MKYPGKLTKVSFCNVFGLSMMLASLWLQSTGIIGYLPVKATEVIDSEQSPANQLLSLIDSFKITGWTTSKSIYFKFNNNTKNAFCHKFNDSTKNSLSNATFQLLSEYHCIESITKNFESNQEPVFLEAYSFPSVESAYGAYSMLRKGSSTVITTGDGSSEDDQNISFWQNTWYIHLYTTAEDSSYCKELLIKLAQMLTTGIARHAPAPPILSNLPSRGKVSGTEHLLMGPQAAREVTAIPLVGMLSIENSQGAISADYQLEEPYKERLRLLVVTYPNYKLAREVYDCFSQNLEELQSSKIKNKSPGLFKLSGSYLLCQLKDNRIIIIHGAHKTASAFTLASQIPTL